MPTNSRFLRHTFAGGWASDFGPSTEQPIGEGDIIQLPFLVEAENVIFEFDGGPHKAPGTAKLNSTDWAQVGNSLTIATVSTSALAGLSATRVAFIDAGNDELRTYDFDGTDWAQVGNSLAIATVGSPALAELSTTRVAFIDSTNDELRTYDFDGTDWAQVGNSLAIATVSVPALAGLSATRVAFIDNVNAELRTYDFDGTDWAQVGNSLAIATVGSPALAELSTTRVAFIDRTNDELRTYDFDGTDWAQVGNSLAITSVASPALAGLSTTRVAFTDPGNAELRAYDFDGTDWALVDNSLAITTVGTSALAELSTTRVAFIDRTNDELRTYDTSPNVIKGIFDAWFSGTAGSPSQHLIIHVDDVIRRDNADGIFTNLFTGMTAGSVPAYSMMEDVLVMSNEDDVPRSWDTTTVQNLAGSPPAFAFSEVHHNRMWAAGDDLQPSRLYYSVLLDPEDWAGAGSGSIDIDPDDGDAITGVIAHKNELWVFKGPYKGSIHRIAGTAPTGDDAFSRLLFIRGLGAVGHNTLFRSRDDIGFMWSDGTIHSLAATASFGDFNEATLSRPINGWLRDHLNFGRLKHAWAADWGEFGQVLFSVPIDGSSNPNDILVMDYRFEPVRWSHWPAFSDVTVCLASVIDATDNDRRIVYAGGPDGFVRKLGRETRSIDTTTSINFNVKTPHINYNSAIMMKTLATVSVGLQPKNNGNITFGWQRDNNAQQTGTIGQGGADVLASSTGGGEFTLGTSTLGGGQFIDRFLEQEEGGEFRSVQFQITNNVNNEDVELHSISARINSGSWSTEN